ncbi:MAG: hypothetical protein QM811_01625 [Pirellulales bacterium]
MAGNKSATRMPMMAITTNSSTNVNVRSVEFDRLDTPQRIGSPFQRRSRPARLNVLIPDPKSPISEKANSLSLFKS